MLHTNEKIIKNKVGLLNLAEELGNVSKACKIMGFSRETFYRYQRAIENGGVEALFEKSRRDDPIFKIASIRPLKKPLRRMRLNTPPLGSSEPVMNFVNKAFLFRPAGFAQFGSGIN